RRMVNVFVFMSDNVIRGHFPVKFL
ncbi:MAG: hypothetical protein H6Q85_1549, partial [candidate division NC10 bacterium]|nr:hypothetical protein [candidate division NC10 bacterium]